MKKFAVLVFSFLLIGMTAKAETISEDNTTSNYRYDGKSYIFVEGGVEFSVFPDGQFDFVYLAQQQGGNLNVSVNTPNVNISYNGGYDYETYVQYDDYGAVIQVEDVPIYYDEFGRISQAGDVEVRYNDRRIVRVGGLQVHYNNYGYFSHATGYVSPYYRTYVYRPWHVYYAPPIYSSCVVYDYPYRRYYSPARFSFNVHLGYYKNRNRVAYHNARRDFYRPGSRVHYENGRVTKNSNYNPNRRNTYVANSAGRTNARSNAATRSTSRGNVSRNNSATRTANSRGSESRNASTTRTSRENTPTKNVSRNTNTNRNVIGNTSRNNTTRKATVTRSSNVGGADRTKTIQRSSNSRGKVTRNAPQRSSANKVIRTPVKRTAQATKSPSRSVNKSSNTRPSRATTAQRSSTSRSKSAGSRSSSSPSSSRGRGL